VIAGADRAGTREDARRSGEDGTTEALFDHPVVLDEEERKHT